MTLGSLFDGVGGWQLAARRAGIMPLWSSEIDEFCMSVTRRHFPDTIQLGDINGIADAAPVDIITAGSPCQDISIAGKRSGLNGERSGLFFRAVELVRRLKPKFFVWENVPGVLSSNGRLDFKAVLEEILQEPVPLPKHWANAGVVDGRHCQLCWRILDAQFWGIPQRRKRIFLVADLTGRRAAKILLEPARLSGNSPPGEGAQQDTAARIGSCTNCAVFDNHGQDSRIKRLGTIAPTVSAKYGTGGNNVPLVAYGIATDSHSHYEREITPPQCVEHKTIVAFFSASGETPSTRARMQNSTRQSNANFNPLTARGAAACATPSIVRRLTPTECERLMGLPDHWTLGGSDAKRYKALGNGMAQPCAVFILRRIKEAL